MTLYLDGNRSIFPIDFCFIQQSIVSCVEEKHWELEEKHLVDAGIALEVVWERPSGGGSSL